jgi:hypothetical protein
VFSALSVQLAGKESPGEFLVEFWGSMVIEDGIRRKRSGDLKC